jgi:pectate lyase
MSLRNISIALASVVVLAAAPAFAQDAGTSQTNVQTNTVTGNRNNTKNTSTQVSGTEQRGRRGGDAATVQSNDQLNDVSGRGNKTENVNTQVSGTSQRPATRR